MAVMAEPVPSQATLRLDAFREQQEARFQARLDGNKRARSLSVDSSPPDSGIDHQTIDALLSRKPNQKGAEAQDQNMLSIDLSSSAKQSSPIVAVTKAPREVPAPSVAKDIDAMEVRNQAGPILEKEQMTIRPSLAKFLSPISTEMLDEMSNDTQFPLCTVQNPISAPSAPASPHTEMNVVKESSSALPLPVDENKTSANLRQSKNDQSREIVDEQPDNAIAKGKKKAKELPQHVASDIQGARSHFRARLHASELQQEETTSSENLPVVTNGIYPAPVESIPTIKSSPNSASLQLDLPKETTAAQSREVSPPSKPPGPIVPPVPIVAAPPDMQRAFQISAARPQRARVVNPATRGRSLQDIAASTVGTLALDFDDMPPPPAPRPAPRINQTNPREESDTGRADITPALRREESKDGPWSREAFDLFGDWKPPQNTNPHILAGVAV